MEAAVAAFGPLAMGQFPGAVFYRMRASKSMLDFTELDASSQDLSYVMAHYALIALINGLDENIFFKRFGVSLEGQCGEALSYLQEFGLIAFSKGVWKFSGKWEFRRVFEYVALSRVLFPEELLLSLRTRYLNRYDPRKDYSVGNSLLKAYTNNWLMTLYYRMGV